MVSIVIYRYFLEEKAKMESLRQRDFIRATFGRYLSNEVVEELLESPGGLNMKGGEPGGDIFGFRPAGIYGPDRSASPAQGD